MRGWKVSRSNVWEEVHLLPMRVKFQREHDGTIAMQLPGYQLREVTVVGVDKGDAIARMDDAMYVIMGGK